MIVVCFAIIYIIWGSTYLANKFAIDTIPPVLMSASRLLCAGIILLVITALLGHPLSMSRRQWRNIAWSGFLFLAVGLAGVVWAEQFIDSNTAAVIVALEPLAVVLVMWIWDGRRPRWTSWVGVTLGIIGSWFLFSQEIIIEGFWDWMGVAAVFVSITAWAVGSVFISRAEMPESKLTTSSYQMLIGGVTLLPLAYFMGDFSEFSFQSIAPNSWIAFGFLVVLGSIVAFSAFNYLLKNVSPDKVATSTYVHPIVAIALGYWLRDELITGQTILAVGIMLVGVLFVNAGPNLFRKKEKVSPAISKMTLQHNHENN